MKLSAVYVPTTVAGFSHGVLDTKRITLSNLYRRQVGDREQTSIWTELVLLFSLVFTAMLLSIHTRVIRRSSACALPRSE